MESDLSTCAMGAELRASVVGAGLSIAATQIPALLGIPGGGHNFIERVFAIAGQFLQVHPVVMGIGFVSIALLWFDLAGARMFLDLYTEIAKRGMILRLVEAHASVRDLLRIEGAEDRVGRIDRFATLNDVIEHFQKEGA